MKAVNLPDFDAHCLYVSCSFERICTAMLKDKHADSKFTDTKR